MHYNNPQGTPAFSNPFGDAVAATTAQQPPNTSAAADAARAPPSGWSSEKRPSRKEVPALDVPTLQHLVATAPAGLDVKRGSIPAVERDERGYLVLRGRDRWGITPIAFSDDTSTQLGRKRAQRVQWIEGLRGILGIQTLLWMFFRIFAPACVTEIDQDGTFPANFIPYSPSWTGVIRRLFSPILFDGGLQMTMFIILIGRVSLLTYFERREALGLAGPCFRRPFRLAVPIAVTLGLVTAVTAAHGFKYAPFLADRTHNMLAMPPVMWDSALEFWNSLVTFFFAPITYKNARAVAFIPPAGTAWFIEVAFQQVYAMIILVWCIPYTIFRYKFIGLVGMILVSAWIGRWSWYTFTGVMIAEFSVVYKQLIPARGLPLNGARTRFIPTWVFPTCLLILGLFFKYLWRAALPHLEDREVIAHADLNTARLNYGVDPSKEAFPRYDNWLVCTGLLFLLELSPRAQKALEWGPLPHLGKLSFSIALTAGTIMLSAGSIIYYCLVHSLGFESYSTINGVLFLILIPLCLVGAEIFASIVDDASLAMSKGMFIFFRS